MADGSTSAWTIFEGVWTDWSKGSLWGLTLTLCPTSAILLTNSMAMFVTLTGLQLWTIVRYVLHQQGTRVQPELSTPHMKTQQLILRNSGSALATAKLMFDLAWTSRKSNGERSIRAYAIAVTAITYGASFMAAGVVSTKAISTAQINGGSPVLLNVGNCGVPNETYFDVVAGNGNVSTLGNFDLFVKYLAKRAQDVQLSLEYAQKCYLSTVPSNDLASTCHTLKAPYLKWENKTTACPFDTSLCHTGSQTIALDTGNINSHDHLGINARASDRLDYRRVTKCTVLNSDSYVRGWDGKLGSISQSNLTVPASAHAFYGPSLSKGTNWTYSYSNYASFYDNFTSQAALPYNLNIQRSDAPSVPPGSPSDFEPVTELAQEQADISLMFLSFNGMYLAEVDDPWFSAHRNQSLAGTSYQAGRFARDTAISTLACTEQHSFCTANRTCTGLLGFNQVQNVDAFNAVLNPYQNASFDRMLRAVEASRIGHIVDYLSRTTTPLLASSASLGTRTGIVVSQTLPSEQWKLELEFWHSIAMAQMQRTIAQWAAGQIAPNSMGLLQPTTGQDKWFCGHFVVPSAAYQSFHVVSIILMATLAILIVLASLFVENLAVLVRRCFGKPLPREQWNYDDLLELKRSRTRISTKPVPWPKDEGYVPAVRTGYVRQGRGLEIVTTDLDNPRASSQALPSADFNFPFANNRKKSIRKDLSPPSQSPIRRSWMTISLESLSPVAANIRRDTTKACPRWQPVAPSPSHQPRPFRSPRYEQVWV